MITFAQFLERKNHQFQVYGTKKGNSPSKLMSSVIRPAKPFSPTSAGLSPTKAYLIPKIGK